MPSAADRQAFLRFMGLTDADVADPECQHRAVFHSQVSSSDNATGKAQRGTKHSSSTASSIAGLSHSASLSGDAAQPSLITVANIPHGTSPSSASGPPSSSRPLFSTPRSVHWEEESIAATSHASQLPQRSGASCSTAAAVSEDLKECGNRAFEAGAFREAVQHYTAAIEALAAGTTHSGAEVLLLGALHSNRSAAYLQAAHEMASAEDAYARALCDADRAVALRPSWFKGHARQGDTYFKLKRYGAAAEAYEMALHLDPHNRTLVNALAESRQRQKRATREELELRRTMRSTASTTSSLASNMSGQAGNLTWCEGDPCGGSAASQRGNDLQDAYDGGHCRSGQTQQLWAKLKHEVEATVHEATGDAYRMEQLERFRARSSKGATPKARQAAESATSSKDAAVLPAGAAASGAMQGRNTAGPQVGVVPGHDVDVGGAAASAFCATGMSAATQARPRRRSSTSPTAGGIVAALATFDGPVQNARDVPYEFSSAAASAYQQRLLEAFRQRKGSQR
ncbi:hypothetical protein LSCM1_08276 [Leishmania martiniquensis]|uniref:Uncharacterized protein n=1 Tax=Leishmania martiniquensis TaxID=1580590 RepID=A0A836I0T0_9TRYP|nr:hypothetical protein LSCM1_08276 [Leishmania martiniquensis]